MHQTSNKGQCCQQPNYSDLAIKAALTTELQFKIRPIIVKKYVLRTICYNISSIQRLMK